MENLIMWTRHYRWDIKGTYLKAGNTDNEELGKFFGEIGFSKKNAVKITEEIFNDNKHFFDEKGWNYSNFCYALKTVITRYIFGDSCSYFIIEFDNLGCQLKVDTDEPKFCRCIGYEKDVEIIFYGKDDIYNPETIKKFLSKYEIKDNGEVKSYFDFINDHIYVSVDGDIFRLLCLGAEDCGTPTLNNLISSGVKASIIDDENIIDDDINTDDIPGGEDRLKEMNYVLDEIKKDCADKGIENILDHKVDIRNYEEWV